MKKIFLFILTVISLNTFSQSKLFIRGDSIYLQSGTNGELILLNSTRNLQYGYLQNIGNGRTKFHYALDSVWIDGDSLRFRYGPGTLAVINGGGGGGTTYAAGYGLTLTSTTFSVDTSKISTKLWRQKGIDSILALLASNYYTQTQINSFFGGTTAIGGYNKTNWDAAFSWGNHAGLYPTVSRFLDSLNAHWLAIQGFTSPGNMNKSDYDTDNDLIVDNSEQLGGQLPSYYAQSARQINTGLWLSGGGDLTANRTLIADSAAMAGYFLRRKDSSVNGGYYPYATNPKSYLVAADVVTNLSWDATNHEVDITGGTSAVIPFATNSASGLMSATAQTFGGAKTFTSTVNNTAIAGYLVLGAGNATRARLSIDGSDNGYVKLYNGTTGWGGIFTPGSLSDERTYTLPNASGTLPLSVTANSTNYTADASGVIDLGTIGGSIDESDIVHKSGDETIAGNKTFTGNIYGEGPITWYNTTGFGTNYLGQLGSQSVGGDSYGTIQFANSANGFQGNIYTDVLTGNRAYTLPDASGMLALSSQILTPDAAPTNGSTNPVQSDGVFDALTVKEATFTETTQEFTGSTSLTLTLSNTLKTSKAVVVFYNGLEMENASFSASGTTVTLSGLTRETTDRIKVKYSY